MSTKTSQLDDKTQLENKVTDVLRDDTAGFDSVVAIKWESESLLLLDQRLLPREEAWIRCSTLDDVALAIREMVVRGAPAIGIAAAYGCVLLMKRAYAENVTIIFSNPQKPMHQAAAVPVDVVRFGS